MTCTIGTASANSVELDHGCASRVLFDNVTLASRNIIPTSNKPCHYNKKFDCSETNGYNIPQDSINEADKGFAILYRYIEVCVSIFLLVNE